MSRQFIQREHLVTIINEELQKYDEGSGYKMPVQSIYQLRKNDEDGCNWSAEMRLIGKNEAPKPWRSILKIIISDMKKKYNIE